MTNQLGRVNLCFSLWVEPLTRTLFHAYTSYWRTPIMMETQGKPLRETVVTNHQPATKRTTTVPVGSSLTQLDGRWTASISDISHSIWALDYLSGPFSQELNSFFFGTKPGPGSAFRLFGLRINSCRFLSCLFQIVHVVKATAAVSVARKVLALMRERLLSPEDQAKLLLIYRGVFSCTPRRGSM